MKNFVSLSILACCLFGQSALAQESGATYSVTFQAEWSADTHPDGFPAGPHFSGLVGAVHNENVEYWAIDGLASPGLALMAEMGAKTGFISEFQRDAANGDVSAIISGGEVNPSPGELKIQQFQVDPDHRFVTLVSTLAPSPDWFVGVSALDMADDGEWSDRVEVLLFAHDAGTDSGATYEAENSPTDPEEPIVEIDGAPFVVNETLVRVGKLVFVRITGGGCSTAAGSANPWNRRGDALLMLLAAGALLAMRRRGARFAL
jgi:MYXO-CTERM domain-containing protein